MKRIKVRLITFLLLISVLLVSCGGYAIDLPNNYKLVNVYGSTHFINSPNHEGTVLGPSVNQYKIIDEIVVGALSDEEEVPLQNSHFILDTKSGDLIKDLSVEDWNEELAKIGLEKKIELKRPNAFHSWF